MIHGCDSNGKSVMQPYFWKVSWRRPDANWSDLSRDSEALLVSRLSITLRHLKLNTSICNGLGQDKDEKLMNESPHDFPVRKHVKVWKRGANFFVSLIGSLASEKQTFQWNNKNNLILNSAQMYSIWPSGNPSDLVWTWHSGRVKPKQKWRWSICRIWVQIMWF